jgi:hypothetical protein
VLIKFLRLIWRLTQPYWWVKGYDSWAWYAAGRPLWVSGGDPTNSRVPPTHPSIHPPTLLAFQSASRMCWREWLTPGHSNRSSGRILDRNSDPIVASHASTIGLQNCFGQKIDRSSGCGVWGDFVIADLVSAHCVGGGGGGGGRRVA